MRRPAVYIFLRMSGPNQEPELLQVDMGEAPRIDAESFALTITVDAPAGVLRFEWARTGQSEVVARGRLVPADLSFFRYFVLDWTLEHRGETHRDGCGIWPASIRAFLNRLRKRFPVPDGAVRMGILTDIDLGMAKAGRWLPIQLPPGEAAWKWLSRELVHLARVVDQLAETPQGPKTEEPGSEALHLFACGLLGVKPFLRHPAQVANFNAPPLLDLRMTLNQVENFVEFTWSDARTREVIGTGRVRCTGADQLTWELRTGGRLEPAVSSHLRKAIRSQLDRWLERLPVNLRTFSAVWVKRKPGSATQLLEEEEPPFGPTEPPYPWIEDNLVEMAESLRFQFSPLGRAVDEIGPELVSDLEKVERRFLRKEQKRIEEETRRLENMARLAEERRRREQHAAAQRKAVPAKPRPKPEMANAKPLPSGRGPLPPVEVWVEMPPLDFREARTPLTDLRGYALRENAALWWVSNQSDDLLCLPHCRIERLEYQLRTALRVLGPLRGRALLSDEVGLGKTIEAGLLTKELLTRGMAKRFLVLTLPSLVDQWAEELNDKFGLPTVTTNQPAARGDAQQFWSGNAGFVASLHTLKQPAQ
ncbi:MAG: SNF2-related protein, partial [Pedosphaera sp.]|nr:SNF2-related protein [Pedosphaera sp.]